MPWRVHALVQHPHDQDTVFLPNVEDDVGMMLERVRSKYWVVPPPCRRELLTAYDLGLARKNEVRYACTWIAMNLELRELTLQYPGKPPLFKGLNLTIEGGDFVFIQGPSGSGKSSLLRLLNRLQEPTSGRILVDDKPAERHDVRQLRRRIGYVQQTPIMVPGTIRENLVLPFRFRISQSQESPHDRVLQQRLKSYLLEDIDLEDDATQMSIGQKQRIALIRTLLTDPELILADEPSSALDGQSRSIVQTELERLNQEQGLAVVLVTHLDFQPETVRPRRFVLDQNGLLETEP